MGGGFLFLLEVHIYYFPAVFMAPNDAKDKALTSPVGDSLPLHDEPTMEVRFWL